MCKVVGIAATAWVILGCMVTFSQAEIVNIGGAVFGFLPQNGQNAPGDSAVPVGTLTQLVIEPGTYTITNATGLPGANPDYTAWQFNTNPNWVWSFVIADDATDTVLLAGVAGTENGTGIWSTKAEVVMQPSVQNFMATLTLTDTTTLNFGIRDHFVDDNAGGISLNIEAVPEPSSALLSMMALAALLHAMTNLQRRRRAA